LVPWHYVNVSPLALVQPDRITALSEGSNHVIHLHLKGHYWLINTGKLSQWHSLTEPYLRAQGVNRLDELILCEAPPHETEVLNQVNSEFQVTKIFPIWPRQPEAQTEGIRVEQFNPSTNAAAHADLVEIYSSDQTARDETSAGGLPISAILVHLGRFRILILPNVTEASLTALRCDHVDVVYCGRLRSRRFPRRLVIAKLTPSVLVLNGTKPEIIANSEESRSSPKCFYLKQEGAITTALLNNDLIIRSYRGAELCLHSLSR